MAKAKTTGTAKKPAARRSAPRQQRASEGEQPRKVKEIAGVKVPKDLREVAASAQKLMENPLVREIVSAGVLAAMAAFAEAQQRKSQRGPAMVGDAAEQAGRNADGLKKTAKVVAGAAVGAMGKKLMEEVKTRGPELIAKMDKSGNGAGETRLGGRRQQQDRDEAAEIERA
jgi:hypothetical protein